MNLEYILRATERYVEAYECFQKAIEIDADYEVAKKALQDIEQVMALLGGA